MNLHVDKSAMWDGEVELAGPGNLHVAQGACIGSQESVGGKIVLRTKFPGSIIAIGERTQIANGVEICASMSVIIGKDCRIGRCLIVDSDFHGLTFETRDNGGATLRTEIGDRVFIGANVIILKGVVIGNDAVIGAGSVVTHFIPPKCIATGNPAEVIREL
jgi:acetyltransferase-like isoleucine patch superfamily enzyme